MHASWRIAAFVALSGTAPLAGGEKYVNGYTYVAPSYYLAPPVVVSGPVLPPPVWAGPAPVMVAPAPVPVVLMEPAFLHTTVMPYDPVWPYAYSGLPGAYYRERVDFDRHGVDYQLKTYGPRGAKTVYSYEVDARRGGVVVRERVR